MHRVLASLWLIALTILAGCNDEAAPTTSDVTEPVISAGTYKRAPCPAGSSPSCVDMYVVAHEDDDVLFMNPDIEQSIQHGNNVIVAYMTAAQVDPSCGTWTPDIQELGWTNRERGILDAYGTMTTSSAAWTASTVTVHVGAGGVSQQAVKYQRPIGSQAPGATVTVYFFRFEDGGFLGWDGTQPMQQLSCSTHCPGNNEVIDGKTVTGTTSFMVAPFTRDDIVASLEGLMETGAGGVSVDSVSTLDATVINYAGAGGPEGTHTMDYGTHLATGLSAVSAYMQYQAKFPARSIHLRTYRGYTAAQEYENLAADQATEKSTVFGHYANWDCMRDDVARNSAGQWECAPGAAPTQPCGSATPKAFGTTYTCPGGGACTSTSIPEFSEHWGRVYSTRSVAGPATLTGRLAYGPAGANQGCVGVVGATVVTPVAATASSVESASYPAAAAIDANGATRWSSAASDPQWLTIDFGTSRYLTRVDLAWETAYGKAYQLQVSDNNTTWTTVYSTTNGPGGTEHISLPSGAKGRYLRMYGTQRGTVWGYSLWEVTAYTYTGVGTTTCAGATPWTLTANHQIQLTGTTQCLESATSGAVSLAACTDTSSATTLVLLSNGQIQANPDLFATNGEAKTTFIPAQCLGTNGLGVSVQSCAKTCIDESTGTQVACENANLTCQSDTDCSYNTTCTWTEYGQRCMGRCDSNNSVCASATQVCVYDFGLAPLTGVCMPRPGGTPATNQNWTLLFDTPALQSSEFSDATEVASASSYYRTFSIGNHDVCARKAGGLYCAPYIGGVLRPATLLDGGYSDASGWYPDENGSTVSAVWDPTVSPSGAMVSGGRGYYGAQCGGLLATDFSTAGGWNAAPYYYDSIRYVDVTGDQKPDICGRGYSGIACATNLTSSFSSASLWTLQFDASHSWNSNGAGDTIQFADINGDGKTDVCGRGDGGIDCQLGTNSSFVSYHPWSYDADRRVGDASTVGIDRDFSNSDLTDTATIAWKSSLAYYGSVKLVDVNRDGLADVCGRGPGGIYCALSVGNGFAEKRLVLPEDFTDGLGWGVADKGSTITFGDLNGNSRVDVCGRGYWGVVCGEGY